MKGQPKPAACDKGKRGTPARKEKRDFHIHQGHAQQENYQFVHNHVSIHLYCPICKALFKHPIRFHPCGHTFCYYCLASALKPSGSDKVCAICLEQVKTWQADLTAAGLVEGLIVRCLSKDCPFKGTLQVYHMFHMDNCSLRGQGGLAEWMQRMKAVVSEQESEGRVEDGDREKCGEWREKQTQNWLRSKQQGLELKQGKEGKNEIQGEQGKGREDLSQKQLFGPKKQKEQKKRYLHTLSKMSKLSISPEKKEKKKERERTHHQPKQKPSERPTPDLSPALPASCGREQKSPRKFTLRLGCKGFYAIECTSKKQIKKL